MISRFARNLIVLLTFVASFVLKAGAQPVEKWNLQKCVEYALKNNISVRQADVQARIVALTYEQSKLSQYPSIDFQNSGGYRFGRSIDPTTNLFTNQEILATNH